jgi:hypothetical protein
MLTDDNCTIFIKNGNGFKRCYVPKCHWQESKASNVLKSGMASADGIAVYIFIKDISEELKTLLTARKSAAQDLIVFGECNFTFDNSTPQSASESLRALNASFDVHTVMSIDKLLYGSPEMQHFKLSAR